LIAEKIAPFFSSTYVEPILQPFYFHIHACNGGVYPPPQRSDVQIRKSKLSCSCGAEIPIRSGRFDVFPIYPLSFHTLAHCASDKDAHPERASRVEGFSSDVFFLFQFRLSPLCSHSCALFCAFLHSAKTQVFSFQAFPHSLPKIPGVGVSPLSRRGTK